MSVGGVSGVRDGSVKGGLCASAFSSFVSSPSSAAAACCSFSSPSSCPCSSPSFSSPSSSSWSSPSAFAPSSSCFDAPHLSSGTSHCAFGCGSSSLDASQPLGTEMPQVRDALDFLSVVKERFAADEGVFREFLDVMKQFKLQSITVEGVLERVRTLFGAHPDLLQGFDVFLPSAYRGQSAITSSHASSASCSPSSFLPTTAVTPRSSLSSSLSTRSSPGSFGSAFKYIETVKKRFQQSPDKYRSFLSILHSYQDNSGNKASISEVEQQIKQLFDGHPDLIEQFQCFLPQPQLPVDACSASSSPRVVQENVVSELSSFSSLSVTSSFSPSLKPAVSTGMNMSPDLEGSASVSKSRKCGFCGQPGHRQSTKRNGIQIITCPDRLRQEGV